MLDNEYIFSNHTSNCFTEARWFNDWVVNLGNFSWNFLVPDVIYTTDVTETKLYLINVVIDKVESVSYLEALDCWTWNGNILDSTIWAVTIDYNRWVAVVSYLDISGHVKSHRTNTACFKIYLKANDWIELVWSSLCVWTWVWNNTCDVFCEDDLWLCSLVEVKLELVSNWLETNVSVAKLVAQTSYKSCKFLLTIIGFT